MIALQPKTRAAVRAAARARREGATHDAQAGSFQGLQVFGYAIHFQALRSYRVMLPIMKLWTVFGRSCIEYFGGVTLRKTGGHASER